MKLHYRLILPFVPLLVAGCADLALQTPQTPTTSRVVTNVDPEHVCDISSLQAAAENLPLSLSGAGQAESDVFLLHDLSLVDPETADDNLVLTGLDQSPPLSEGVTVQADGPLFDFPVVENDKVRYFVDYYTGPGKKVFTRWLQRSGRYLPMMREVFAEQGLPRDLAYLAMVESGFNERAYSWAHAVGPWQFIEKTGRGYGLNIDWWYDERRDFVKSTRAAAAFLADLYRRFDGDWYLAVASYNAGGGKINRAVKKYNSRDFWILTRGSFLQPETKNYVPKLLAVLLIAKQPEKYGFTDLKYLAPFEYDLVALPSETDLEVIARLSGTDYPRIKTLNPELKRWCTPPGVKGYEIRIPAGSRDQFVKRYTAMNPTDRVNYLHHRIRSGDTLLKLAKQHRIRVEDIISLNHIRDPRVLRVGTDLVLPLKKGYTALPLQELEDDYIRTRRRTYTVRSGDSLWKISQRFGITQKELRVWNRLGWSNLLRPGQKLAVSARGQKRRLSKSAKGPLKRIEYLVKAGDTLWGIGRKYDVSTSRIRNWNNLRSGQLLHPGDRLTLHVAAGQRG